MAKLLELNSGAVALSAAAVDALIARGSGDAALLYLYLLRHGGYYDPAQARKATGWDVLRLDGALLHLQELGLAGQAPDRGGTQPSPAAPERERAPEYSTADITEALEQPDTEFSQLLRLVEAGLGKKLGVRDLKILYELLDYLALPPDVILTLVQWQISCAERKYGPGRRPNMTTIRNRAYYWKQCGVDTMDAADAFLKKQELQATRKGELLSACGIVGRAPTDGEERYLSQWIDWGVLAEVAAYAYDITVTNTGRFSWAYCNKVLQRWQEKGLRTLAEVQGEKLSPRRKAAKAAVPIAPAPARPRPQPTPEQEARQAEQDVKDTRWMQQLLERLPPKSPAG